MAKLVAILNVIAWSGFWAFGYLALTTEPRNTGQMVIAALLAAAGGALGMVAYLWLVRHAEKAGHAPPSPQVPREHHRQQEGQG
ncbi:hypothetical protein [Ostreiculturibacter nitratireducens]|uniref:hypothetical protein n=1 Tax=Ostreiculturibacter nitratireducens TaxID=3075226 RepID=UPI0031B61CFB